MAQVKQGYYSLLRWRKDVGRDECRNVAIVLLSEDGQFGGIRPAPISSISPNLRQQGMLDAVVNSLSKEFENEIKPDVSRFAEMAEAFQDHSLIITEPKPAAITDPVETLNNLYKALVQPPGGSNPQAKGTVLDRVVRSFRRIGYEVGRSEYFDDFMFDAILTTPGNKVVLAEVLSFSSDKRNWIVEERDVGHFLYGLHQVGEPGIGVIQPPSPDSSDAAKLSYERVSRWLDSANVVRTSPGVMSQEQIEQLLAR